MTAEDFDALDGPLVLPAVPKSLMTEVAAVEKRYAEEPDFGGVRLHDDRKGFDLYWHKPDADRLPAATDGSVYEVDVVATVHRRKDLQREAERLIETLSDPAAQSIVMAHVNRDSSGLVLGVESAAAVRSAEQLVTSYPYTVEVVGSIEPTAGRLLDEPPYSAGGRIYDRNGGGACTSAFAVRRIGGVDGMLTAAHCGDTGTVWDTTSGRFVGSVTGRTTEVDAEFMAGGASYMPAVFWGSYATTTRVWITGAASPQGGNEICYSGSYSGTICGNLVSDTDVLYDIGGDLDAVVGFRTEQFDGVPAVGNGDSGGPAVLPILSSDGATYELWAGGVISAMSNAGPDCRGVPADPLPPPDGRWCSPSAVAADIADSVNELNAQILVTTPP